MAALAGPPDLPVYQVSGFPFASAVEFPELTAVRARPCCTFAIATRPLTRRRPAWYHVWTDTRGAVWTRLARTGNGYLLRFPRLCDFLIARDASRVEAWPRRRTPVATVRHLFLNQALPLVLAERGRLVLHASAVATSAGAIAFLGATGLGKSTLAASFTAAGAALVTDDSLLVTVRDGDVRAVPSHPSLRLRPGAVQRIGGVPAAAGRAAHYTTKLRVPAAPRLRFARRPVRLIKAYVLDPPARPQPGGAAARITPLSRRAALTELIAHLYRLDAGSAAALRRDLDRLVALTGRLPMARLRPARGLARLAAVRRAVLDDVGGEVNREKSDGRGEE